MSDPRLPVEEDNPFDGLEPEAVCAFVHRAWGEQALREMFALGRSIGRPLAAEDLEDLAIKVEDRGLLKLGAVLRDIGTGMPTEEELAETDVSRAYSVRCRERKRRFEASCAAHKQRQKSQSQST